MLNQQILAAWNQLKQKLSVHQNSTCRSWTLAKVRVSRKELATEKAWREKEELKKWLELRSKEVTKLTKVLEEVKKLVRGEKWEELEQWAKI